MKWIKVEDELPPPGTSVIGYNWRVGIALSCINEKGEWEYEQITQYSYDPHYWMPLPELPE